MSNGTSSIDSKCNDDMVNFIEENSDTLFSELDFRISESEIQKSISKLKTGKSCGLDQISNEMLKAGRTVMSPVLCKLFNSILSHGQFPEIWRYNTLTPLHKKGDPKNPANYRGIALTSNLCKLFCSVLHSRLTTFIDDKNLIPVHQIGFQARTRTADHVFTLKCLVDKYISKCTKGRLYTCFVDFKSAFDSISRISLYYKLLKLGIGGRFLKFLRDMYSTVYYCVKLPDGLTENFQSFVGVKQGCVLSPTLFNLFVADLPNIFDNTCDPVSLNNYSLSCLMFADDLVLMSESSCGLQSALNKLHSYCSTWGLEVNADKTKILIFNKSGRLLKDKFYFGTKLIDNTNKYKYLGIIFSASGSFCHAVEHLTEQAGKALFKLKQRQILNNPATALKLFDMLIVPILRYCAEIWSPGYINKLHSNNLLSLCEKCPVEKIHNKFCRFVLGVNRYTTTAGVKAELGRRPLLIHFLIHSMKYWFYLCDKNINTLVRNAYLDTYSTLNSFRWISQIKLLLNTFQLAHVWDDQGSKYKNKIIYILKSNMFFQHDNEWRSLITKQDSKLRTYSIFKLKYDIENFLLSTSTITTRDFIKLRLSAHRLRIETGRYTRPQKTPLDDRTCLVCGTSDIEDEKHFLLHCSKYDTERRTLFNRLSMFTSFMDLNENDQFIFLMSYNDGDLEILKIVTEFVNTCMTKRKSLLNMN